MQCENQVRLLSAYERGGRLGLAEAIYEEAKERLHSRAIHGQSSWQEIVDDHEDDSRGQVYQLLMLLPSFIIRSLIRNTIARDMMIDGRVKKFVTRFMLPDTMPPVAGIYINVLHRATRYRYRVDKIADPEAGAWLSSLELKNIVAKIMKYLDNHPQDILENRAIDTAFGSS